MFFKRRQFGNLNGSQAVWCNQAAVTHHAAGVDNGQLVLVDDNFAPACAGGGCAIDPKNPNRVLLTTISSNGGNPPSGCTIPQMQDPDQLNSDGSIAKWGGCSAWDCQSPAPRAAAPAGTVLTSQEQYQILQQTAASNAAPPEGSFLSRNKIPIFLGGTILILGFVGMVLLMEV